MAILKMPFYGYKHEVACNTFTAPLHHLKITAQQPSRLKMVKHAQTRGPSPVTRALHKMPKMMRESFSAVQLEALEGALGQQNRIHKIDYRVSLPWFGRRAYITLLAGEERRSLARLQDEGQIAICRVAMTYGIAMTVILGLMLVSGYVFFYSLNEIFYK